MHACNVNSNRPFETPGQLKKRPTMSKYHMRAARIARPGAVHSGVEVTLKYCASSHPHVTCITATSAPLTSPCHCVASHCSLHVIRLMTFFNTSRSYTPPPRCSLQSSHRFRMLVALKELTHCQLCDIEWPSSQIGLLSWEMALFLDSLGGTISRIGGIRPQRHLRKVPFRR